MWWLAATAFPPLTTVLLMAVLPGPLVLPALAMVLLAIGFPLALAGRGTTRRAERPLLSDVGTALVLFGFAASVLTDGGAALEAVHQIEASLAPHGATVSAAEARP